MAGGECGRAGLRLALGDEMLLLRGSSTTRGPPRDQDQTGVVYRPLGKGMRLMGNGIELAREEQEFLRVVVAFPEMEAGDPCELLLRVADQLCAELGCNGEQDGETPAAQSPLSGDRGVVGDLDPEDHAIVMQVRRRLARFAAGLSLTQELDSTVAAALDGSELVMRGELAKGNRQRLPTLMPSFVLLIALPIVNQDQALALSRRASELIEAAADC